LPSPSALVLFVKVASPSIEVERPRRSRIDRTADDKNTFDKVIAQTIGGGSIDERRPPSVEMESPPLVAA